MRGNCLPVDTLALFGEELDEVGTINDLTLGLGKRLALLHCQQKRQLVDVLDDEVVPTAQDLRAFFG